MVVDEPGRIVEPGNNVNAADSVVCTHGLWSHGTGMYLIKRHLEREYDMKAFIFNYPSVTKTLDENAGRLARFIEENGIERAHLVGHSLGGLVILRMLANRYSDIPGRIVRCAGHVLPLSSMPRAGASICSVLRFRRGRSRAPPTSGRAR